MLDTILSRLAHRKRSGVRKIGGIPQMALHFRFPIGVASWTGDGRLAPTPKSWRRRARVRAFQGLRAAIGRLFRVREFVLGG
jgi:hypothetical protein